MTRPIMTKTTRSRTMVKQMAEISIAEATKEMFAAALANQIPNDGDYYSPEDGLLYCGSCHTPKQCRISIPTNGGEEEVIAPVLCKCGVEKRDAEARKKKELEDMRIVEALRKKSLMDEKFKAQRFESFKITAQNERAFRLCKRYAERFDEMVEKNQGLLFFGDVGTGKTFAASCIANYLLERRKTVVMTSFIKILNAVTRDGEEDLIEQLNRTKLLIIDDLGAERSTEYALEKVYNIIDSRYRTGLPLILTTNLDLRTMQEATEERYKRIYDRIFEVCYPVKFTGASFRKTEAKRRFDEMKALLEGE